MRSKIGFSIFFAVMLLVLNFAVEGNAGCSNDSGTVSSRLMLNYSDMREDVGRDIGSVSIFNQKKGFLDVNLLKKSETLRLYGERLRNPTVSVGGMLLGNSSSGESLPAGNKKRIAVSMLSSALFPGLGELYLYFDSGFVDKSILARAIGFMAIEGYLWYGYNSNHDKGKDFKRQYEDYGDTHWSEDRFLDGHPYCYNLGGCESWEYYNENAKDDKRYFYYTAKEVDREEYYENMGKYDAFLYGWDDWEGADPQTWDGDYENLDYWTPHRTHFVSLRDESNKYLLRADQHIMGMIALRIVSVVHAGWLASRGSRRDDSKGWSFKLENSPVRSRLSLNYGF
ncbi:hypothetical protein J7M07_04965 [bacterium]|nr:hypothetical protein [bacterium]